MAKYTAPALFDAVFGEGPAIADLHDNKRTVVVTGDVSVDWNLAHLDRAYAGGSTLRGADTAMDAPEWGAAALLHRLIARMGQASPKGLGACEVIGPRLPGPASGADRSLYDYSYAIWDAQQQDREDKSDGAPERRVWRLRGFEGVGRADAREASVFAPDAQPEPTRADLIVVADEGLGFRDLRDFWPRVLRSAAERQGLAGGRWVLLKMSSEVAQGEVWDRLSEQCHKRLVVVITAHDLRRSEVHVSRGLSWERTAQDLLWELMYNSKLSGLADCAHVVVSLGPVGALWLSNAPGPAPRSGRQCKLLFDPAAHEDTWGARYPGAVIGSGTCLTAAIANQIALAPKAPDIAAGIQAGVAGMRKLRELGYGATVDDQGARAWPRFPLEGVVEEITTATFRLSEVRVPSPDESRGSAPDPLWTILDATNERRPGGDMECARSIVTDGTAALKGVPLGRFGDLVAADRREIEALRAIQALIGEYCASETKVPTSIAVFGPPGSGKSFSIREVAKTVRGAAGKDVPIKDLTFNLSQLSTPSDLIQALHQVRDAALDGKLPLVFWDEFDTTLGEPLGWLRYFLAPTQDGTFQQGEITHPIGRAIFVFAGGTCHTMEQFDRSSHPDQTRRREFIEAKGPDFVSRLKGFIDILGPDRCPACPGNDPHHLVRRALILRGMLARFASHLFVGDPLKSGKLNIDHGVLQAFLEVSGYRHGARSMEAIIRMSTLAGRASFERSSLPPLAQLNLHVNGRGFLSIVQSPLLGGDEMESLAKAFHDAYRAGQVGSPGAPPNALKQYDELDEDVKETNRDSVRHMRMKLAAIGYAIAKTGAGTTDLVFTDEQVNDLARMEHDRWMLQKIAQGCRHPSSPASAGRPHRALLPWDAMTREDLVGAYGQEAADCMGTDALPSSEKRKDCDAVRAIPGILRAAGYAAAPWHPEAV